MVYFGPFVMRAVWSGGTMGYSRRWRRLAPITTHFKIVLNRCEWCGKRIARCQCPDDFR